MSKAKQEAGRKQPGNTDKKAAGNKRGFFAVDKKRMHRACRFGMNTGVAYLVLCNGTEGSNTYTSWSINAIEKYTGISRSRAKTAVNKLLKERIIQNVNKDSQKPRYSVKKEHEGLLNSDDMVWLPSGIVQSVNGENPPLERLRQTQDVMTLQFFFDLYGVQNLNEDGGIPRSVWFGEFEKTVIAHHGIYDVCEFALKNHGTTRTNKLKKDYIDAEPPEGKGHYHHIFRMADLLKDLGLVDHVFYLFEGEDDEAEITHTLDEGVYTFAEKAAVMMLENIKPGLSGQVGGFLLPVPRSKPNSRPFKVLQLRYKPRTKLTGRWHWNHKKDVESAKEYYEAIIDRLAGKPENQAKN